MHRLAWSWLAVTVCMAVGDHAALAGELRFRRIALDEYIDKMKGGWIGQMVGVGWGGPTEVKFQGGMMAASAAARVVPGARDTLIPR